MRVIGKIIVTLVYFVILAVALYLVAVSFHLINQTVEDKVQQFVLNSPLGTLLPNGGACRFPKEWNIGRVDWGFNMTRADIETAIEKAEGAWNRAASTTLFAALPTDSTNAITINLVYDERQKETDFLKTRGLSIDKSRESFDKLNASYQTLQTEYRGRQGNYDTATRQYQSDSTALNQTIGYWNSRGGAPKAEYDTIQAKQAAVNAEYAALEKSRAELNNEIDNINNLAAILNEMAKELNVAISDYNSSGKTVRNVFEAGDYESDAAGERINVYQFENSDRLVGILEHELGHSLGLQHVQDKNDIMYYENQGQNENITPSDVVTLKTGCPNLK